MADNNISGIFYFKLNGKNYSVSSDGWTYNLGKPKGEAVLDSTGKRAGNKVIPQVSFIEGPVINTGDLDTEALLVAKDVTGTLELANGKVLTGVNGIQVGEGTGDAAEAKVNVRFEFDSLEEVL